MLEDIKSTYLHIDSRNRSKQTKIKEINPTTLKQNPLIFKNNSNKLVIKHANHGFEDGSSIIITEITSDTNTPGFYSL